MVSNSDFLGISLWGQGISNFNTFFDPIFGEFSSSSEAFLGSGETWLSNVFVLKMDNFDFSRFFHPANN